MPPEFFDFFDPPPEEQNVVLVKAATLREAGRLIESREHCNPEGAEIPYDAVLDHVTGCHKSRATKWRSWKAEVTSPVSRFYGTMNHE